MVVYAAVDYVKEVAHLREELEEARGDLADQQDAIGGVMAQRDAFEVEVRRLEFLLQLAVSCHRFNSIRVLLLYDGWLFVCCVEAATGGESRKACVDGSQVRDGEWEH